jgi:hypothetical protein
MSAKSIDRRWLLGVSFIGIVAGLIYLSAKSEHQIAVELKPLTVHLNFSDHVKQRISETHAVLGVTAIVSDKEIGNSPLEATVLDHREQVVRPGEDTARFESKSIDVEVPRSMPSLDPIVTFKVVSRFDQPSGNCIHCESPVLKLSSLQNGAPPIELKCDGWLEMGVCVWQK